MNLIKLKSFEKIIKILFYLLPISIIFSKFFSDLTVVILAIFFLLNNEAYKIENNKKIYFNFFFITFFLLIIFSSLSSFLSINQILSLKSSLLHIRFLLFSLCVAYLFMLDTNKILKIFFYVLLTCYLILLFDGSFQFFFKKNIIGYVTDPDTRVSSLFFDELVLGSYLARLFPVLIFLYLFLKLKINKYLVTYFLLHLYFVTFISGERLSFIILNIYYFLFALFLIKGKTYKIIYVLSFILLFISFINFLGNYNPRSSITTIKNQFTKFNFTVCDETKKRIKSSTYLIKKYNAIEITGQFGDRHQANDSDLDKADKKKSIPNCDPIFELGEIKIYYIFSLMHHNHYLSALAMFKDNLWFGVGPKNFRYICKDQKFFLNEFSCSTHPHNYLLQLLSETGIFGFSCFLLAYLGFIYLFLKEIINFRRDNSALKLILISSILINLFPLFPSGSLFNNWNSILYTIPFGILLGYYKHSVWK